MPTETEKVVCYVVRDGRLLVFTHDDLPLQVTGVQVPAGTVKPGEGLENAAVRELFEETGLRAHRIHYVGTHPYDLRPARNEIAVRHYFLMEPMSYPTDERWPAEESDPSTGGSPISWTCWWLPLQHGHVLAAGFGAMLGQALTADTAQ